MTNPLKIPTSFPLKIWDVITHQLLNINEVLFKLQQLLYDIHCYANDIFFISSINKAHEIMVCFHSVTFLFVTHLNFHWEFVSVDESSHAYTPLICKVVITGSNF